MTRLTTEYLKCKKGYIIAVVLIMVTLFSLMVTAVLTLSMSDILMSILYRNKTSAFYLAESGVHDVIFSTMEEGVQHNTSIYPTDPPSLLSTDRGYDFGPDRGYAVWVSRSGSKLVITSEGTCNKVRKVVETHLAVPWTFPSAILETSVDPDYIVPQITLQLPGGADEGPLTYPTLPGGGGNPKKGGGGGTATSLTIDGFHYYSEANIPSTYTLTVDASTTPADIYIVGSMTFNGDAILNITGSEAVNIHVGGNLSFVKRNKISFGTGSTSKVTFFVNGAILIDDGQYGNPADPSALIFYQVNVPSPASPTEKLVTFGNSTTLYGAVCAPASNIALGRGVVQGALVGWTVDGGRTPAVTYDTSLSTIIAPNATWRYAAWSER